MSDDQANVTQLLKAWGGGDRAALESLTFRVYEELHRLASGYMRREREGNALQATALVNEAFLEAGGRAECAVAGPRTLLRHLRQHHAAHPDRPRPRQGHGQAR